MCINASSDKYLFLKRFGEPLENTLIQGAIHRTTSFEMKNAITRNHKKP